MSEKAHVKRAKALRISAWVLLAISVPVLLLFAVGIGVLLTPKIKKWKGKTHDR